MKTLYLLATILLLSGCGSTSGPTDTPTTGHIKISVDETFLQVIDSELNVFHSLYKYAVISPSYVPELQAIKDLISDSARIAIITRDLTDEERQYFDSQKLFPKTIKVATDAIALITHPENPDSTLTMNELSDVFTGKKNNWKNLNSTSPLDDILLVFDNKSSSTARYIREKFNTDLPGFTYAVNTNPEVIEYVATHKNAMGVIGVNWISDSHDSASIGFMQRVNVLRISADSVDVRGKQPYQAYIAQGSYPLTRPIYIINREARSGLGTGFASFVASDKGQRIILKAGLVPATMPVRIIGFNN